LLAIIDDVRTSIDDPGCAGVFHNLKLLRERCEKKEDRKAA